MSRSTWRTQALDILNRLGFSGKRAGGSLEELSRGMQQKVAIARALLTSPVLLLLDEPTTGLDPRSRREVQDFILEVRRDHEATVLLTTHDMTEAERLCDRVVLPAWVRPFSIVSPGTYALRAARKTLLEGAGVSRIWPELLTLLLIGVILIPAGLFVFRWGERHAMKTGKLKRNG